MRLFKRFKMAFMLTKYIGEDYENFYTEVTKLYDTYLKNTAIINKLYNKN